MTFFELKRVNYQNYKFIESLPEKKNQKIFKKDIKIVKKMKQKNDIEKSPGSSKHKMF